MTETRFAPGPQSLRSLRDTLGCFGTGVTVVTTMCDLGPLAMTANSFAAVSLDPALVLWSPAKGSTRHAAFTGADHFIIHVMADDQLALAQHFAGDGLDFDGVDWAPSDDGQPLLAGCLARFECARHAVHDGGDHSIILGQVLRAAHRPGTGLIFKRGEYGGFSGFV
ncbi:MAG: flavin reductase family protein [Marinibacterium sp.]|nr:flavin reductase family protein [Marinibacterium sp.]